MLSEFGTEELIMRMPRWHRDGKALTQCFSAVGCGIFDRGKEPNGGKRISVPVREYCWFSQSVLSFNPVSFDVEVQ